MTERILLTLCPQNGQFLIENKKTILLFLLCSFLFGVEQKAISLVGLSGLLVLGGILLGRFWYMSSVRWIITDKQIKYIRGIFNTKKDYMELYRIIDYSEKQSFIQSLIGVKDVYIVSGDVSNPILRIYGVKNNLNIVEIISTQVELIKERKKVYEITNH